MNARAVSALVLAAAVVAAVWALSREDAPSVPEAPPSDPSGVPEQGTTAPGAASVAPRTKPFQAASECRACHEDVWKEWKASYHGMAWSDPMVQKLSGGFQQTECIDCHAPQPIHLTGVAQRVAPRSHARGDGVDCLSCHLMPDRVSVAATRAVDTSGVAGACRPVEVPEMADVDVCAGCHNQHETVNELGASGLTETCADCHMAETERTAHGGGRRTGRSHVFPGAHDVEMHRKAASLDVAVEDGEVVARVKNVGAGHKIPTDARHRSYNLWIQAVDDRGNPWGVETQMPDGEMRLYYRDQFKPSTQVAFGEEHVSRWRIPEGLKGRAKVRLTYALNPDELGAGRVTEVRTAEVEIR